MKKIILIIILLFFVCCAAKFKEATSMMPKKLSFAKQIQAVKLDDNSGAVITYISNDNRISANVRIWYAGDTKAKKFLKLQKTQLKTIQINKIEVCTTNGISASGPDKGLPYQTYIWQKNGWIFVSIVIGKLGVPVSQRKQFGKNLIIEIIKSE